MYSEYHLEDIVVSLALARKLKELNIKYPTPFYWRVWDDGYSDCVIGEYDYEKHRSRIKERVSTYTSTQLIEKMPHSITFLGDYFYFLFRKMQVVMKYLISQKSVKSVDVIEDLKTHLLECTFGYLRRILR